MTPTVDAAFLKQTAANPARVLVQDMRGPMTAGELAVGAYLLSGLLRAKSQRARIGICLPSIKEYHLAVFATLLAGKTVVPLNFLLQPREMGHVLKDSGVDLVITSSHFADKLKPTGLTLLQIEDLAGAPRPDPLPTPRPAADPQEIAILLYTTGTTALPKGVMITHGNLLAQMGALQQCFDLPNFHLLSALPLFHTFALTCCVMLPALTPARASLLPTFDPLKTLQAMPQFGANTMLGVSSMYRLMAHAAKQAGLDAAKLGMKTAVAGGEKLADETRRQFEAVMGLELLEGLGLTEHSPVVSVNLPGRNRPGTVGQPIPGVEWRVVDENGNALPPGTEGELQLRGASVMKGYHSPDPANPVKSPISEDGWLSTGDLAVIDADNYARLTGRIKELIIAAGKNIHPAEIEEVLMTHPAVDECACVAMPDKTRGEAPAVFVALREGAAATPEELRDFLDGKLADYKLPRLIRIEASLPHGPTGKVFRRALKEKLAAERAEWAKGGAQPA